MAAICALAGCGEPASRVVAVWLDGQANDEGNRGVRIYEAGERRRLTFEPTIPDSETDLLQVAVERRGRGVVLSGRTSTTYVEIEDGGGRVGRLDASLVDESLVALAPDFFMLKNDDAILRQIAPDDLVTGPRWAMLPTRATFGLRPLLLQTPGAATLGSKWTLASASDAPVIVWTEARGNPLHPEGAIVATAYPGDSGPGVGIVEPIVLARGVLQGRPIDDTAGPGRVPGIHCPRRLCVSPSAELVYTMADQPCVLWRWSWKDAVATGGDAATVRIALPGCPAERDPWLAAVLDDERVVLDDDDRLYLFDLNAGVMQAVPKLGRGLSRVEIRDRGHVLVYVSHEGEVIRIDADGPRLVSAERGLCSVADSIAVSPLGHWVIVTCAAFGGDFRSDGGGTVMRVSALGLEQWTGIAMRPLAIDDEGNALLYSFDSDDLDGTPVPRGLFVLGGDGQLARVDDLEPAPAEIALYHEVVGRTMGRFAAAALP